MNRGWYSNGKLMLTGEYAVLYGAKSLAVPVKYGQSLNIKEEEGEASLLFKTHVLRSQWFEARYKLDTFEISGATDVPIASYLQQLLIGCRVLNPVFLKKRKTITALANIDFHIDWGLGSSSSLISNIAWWADVDPFELNQLISKGSGYDIACARSDKPVLYILEAGKPVIEPVELNPACAGQLWFVYLGKKQSTTDSLANDLNGKPPASYKISEITDISDEFVKAQTIHQYSDLMERHENILSGILGKDTIQTLFFQDFKGAVKSLGAWGGDFCMAATAENGDYVKSYFGQKGLTNVLSFKELLL